MAIKSGAESMKTIEDFERRAREMMEECPQFKMTFGDWLLTCMQVEYDQAPWREFKKLCRDNATSVH
jgi:hypothetical protein